MDLNEASARLDLPKWWVEYVALERLDCRSFFTSDNWIGYDLELDETAFRKIQSARVLLTGPSEVFLNVDAESVKARMLKGIAGGYFEPLSESAMDEGRIPADHFVFQPNAKEQSDPMTSFSQSIYTKHAGDLYKWKIAELRKGHFAGQAGRFPPRERSFYIPDVSEEHADLIAEFLYKAQRKQEEITHVRRQVPDEITETDGRTQLHQLYTNLRELYAEYYDDFFSYAEARLEEYEEGPTPRKAPLLTSVDRSVTVDEEGNVHGRTSVEALTYRTAVQAAQKAHRIHNELQNDRSAGLIEQEMEESVIAIVQSVQSLESYINGVAQEEVPDYWDNLEKINIRAKWQTVPHLVTGEKVFEPGDDAFGDFERAVTCRNNLVHYKKEEDEFIERQDYGYVSPVLQYANYQDARRAVSAVQKMIKKFAEARGEQPPRWLTSNLWLHGHGPAGEHDPLDFDFWIDREED